MHPRFTLLSNPSNHGGGHAPTMWLSIVESPVTRKAKHSRRAAMWRGAVIVSGDAVPSGTGLMPAIGRHG